MHIFYAAGLADCTSNPTTHSSRVRLHPEANGYAKRLLADLQSLAFVPEWSEQVANVELEFGDVFRLGSTLNEWFLSLDLRQFRAAFLTQTVAPCRVELSDDEGDDDLEGENENYIYTLLDEDGWECGQRWPTARALAAHQRHTQGERMENQREWQAWWSQISASGAVRHMPVLRLHPNTWQQHKDTTDAWLMLVGFTILSSTFLLTPSAHVVISS